MSGRKLTIEDVRLRVIGAELEPKKLGRLLTISPHNVFSSLAKYVYDHEPYILHCTVNYGEPGMIQIIQTEKASYTHHNGQFNRFERMVTA